MVPKVLEYSKEAAYFFSLVLVYIQAEFLKLQIFMRKLRKINTAFPEEHELYVKSLKEWYTIQNQLILKEINVLRFHCDFLFRLWNH